jgi:glycosyltransferase involved in cell wall biosynthesis
MVLSILFWLFASASLVQLLYAVGVFGRIFSFPTPKPDKSLTKQSISVIICARDEAHNLKAHIPQIMAQRYTNDAGKPLFEVFVVNDCSNDNTELVLQELEQQYDNLWHVTISPGEERIFPGKKFALSEGLKHAGNNLLLLIDADCIPASADWMDYMAAPLNQGKEIVAGYGKYLAENSLLNAFTRWETMHTFLQYSCYTLMGKPYMAVGRNMACTKEIFLKAQQTDVWSKLPSGDDDLLVSTMATKDNMAIVCNKQAFTLTESKRSWSDWLKQKQRHLSTGKYYKEEVKTMLGLYAVTHMFTWLLFFVLLAFMPEKALYYMIIRSAVMWLMWSVAAAKLDEKAIIPLFPLFDIGWMIYNFVLSPYIVLKNKTQWK